MLKIKKILALAAFLNAAIYTSSVYADTQLNNPALYECNLSGVTTNTLPGCAANTGGGTETTTGAVRGDGTCSGSYCGASANTPLAVTPIEFAGLCRWIDNSGSNAVFVPFKTSSEWQQFLANAPSYIQLNPCSLPYTSTPLSIVLQAPYPSSTSVTVDSPSVYGKADGTGTSVWPSAPQLLTSGQFNSNGTPITSANLTSYNGATTIEAKIQWKAGTPASPAWVLVPTFSPNLMLTAKDTTASGAAGTTITITPGDQVKLSYSVSSIYGTIVSNTPSNWSGVNGATVTPTTNTVYTITSKDSNGLVSVATVTVNIGVVGTCGADANQSLLTPPTQLCGSGNTPSSVTTASNGWTWTCTPATSGGAAQVCSATKSGGLCDPGSCDVTNINNPICLSCVPNGTVFNSITLCSLYSCRNGVLIQRPSVGICAARVVCN